MRILLIVPPPPAPVSGNERTALRLAEGMRARGHEVIRCPAPEANALADRVERGELAPFDLVHVYHAFRAACDRSFATPAHRPARVLTFAGSDLPGLPLAVQRDAVIAREVARADAAMVAFREQRVAVERAWPSLRDRVLVVPKGVVPPTGDFPLRARLSCRGDERLALLVAGLRPVKGIVRALDWFAPVVAAEPRARLVLIGPVIDADHARAVRARFAVTPWAWWLSPVAHDAMGGVYGAADVVINTSDYEGQSNALLEALAAGRPVVARDVPGNREWLRDGEIARLVANAEEFLAATLTALRREPASASIAEAGRRWVAAAHAPEREFDAIEALYAMARARAAEVRPGGADVTAAPPPDRSPRRS